MPGETPDLKMPAAGCRGAVILLPYDSEKRWHERPLYSCHLCSYTTTNEQRIQSHVQEHVADDGGST